MKSEKSIRGRTKGSFRIFRNGVHPCIIFRFSSFILLALSAVSCDKTTIIPDDELALIFRDAYIVNAYVQNNRVPDLDSLNIYEPIFARYGYTTEDVQFTIGNFAKRKSARMSDVVDAAIEMLGRESNFYKWRVAIADSIGNIARDRYAAVVYTDTLIRVRRISDTSQLRIVIPIDRQGTYDVSYGYFVDTADRNTNLRVNHYLLDANNRRSAANSRRLKRAERDRFTGSFIAGEDHRQLVLDLNGYAEKDKPTRPHLTIDTLVVKRFLPDRVARDSMARELFDYDRLDSIVRPRVGWPRPDSIVYIILPDETDIVTLPADS